MYAVSGTISLPALACSSPVPHGTRSLSLTRESLALEGAPPSFTPASSAASFQSPCADSRIDRMCLLQPRHSHGVMGWARAPFARRCVGLLRRVLVPPGPLMSRLSRLAHPTEGHHHFCWQAFALRP